MEGHQGFFLTIGNGGGVELKLNGESLGVPGKIGKVVRVTIPKGAERLRVPKPSRQVEVVKGVADGDTPPKSPTQPKQPKQEAQEVPEVDGEEREDDGFD